MLYADLIATNGNLITLDANRPRAQALAVRAGQIVAVGANADVLALTGPTTERVDLQGKTVVSGFIDSHIHLAAFGKTILCHANLHGVSDIDELLGRIAEHARHSGREWIEGRGFDQEGLTDGRWPTRTDLDRVSSTQPILLTRLCGHAVVANSAALERISPEARAAGDIESGLFTEGAIAPFYGQIPVLSESEMEDGILRAARVLLKTGITAVGTLLDEGVEGAQMGAYRRLHARGKLPVRVVGMPPASAVPSLHANGIATGFGDDWLRFGGTKFFSDGSLGARTALLAAPYHDEDRPDNLGIRIYDPERLKALAIDAHAKGFQIVIHAIGDQAIRESLDAIEAALGPDGDNTIHRHRIEHASLLPPDLLARMAAHKIVAVVQPQFVLSDYWTGERVGIDRAAWAYPFRQMRDAGIPLALSSDCPVERADAFACLSAVVNRAPWSPNGGLTVEEAIHDYCLGSAYALHAEERLGSLAVGKHADFVVLSADPTAVALTAIGGLAVEAVYVAGRRCD